MTQEKEQGPAQQPDGESPQAPFLPKNDEDAKETKEQTTTPSDNLTAVSNIIKDATADNPSGKEQWMKQAGMLVRQYCRLAVIPKTESAVVEELR